MRAVLLVIGTVALMIVCGAVAAVVMLRLLMAVGMSYHNNYEYYGQGPAVLLIPIAGIIGFATPGFLVWRLHKNQWRVSLRTMLIATTVVAVLLGACVFFLKS